MLHAVIIITASGLILFQKEFALLPSSSASLSSNPSSLPLSSSSSLSHSGASSPSYISLSSKSGQLAGILTAVVNFSLSRLGGQVSYIQCDHVGVALHVHPQTKVTCAVFHQVQDGEDFGRLMARELLQAFAATYRSLLSTPVPRSDMFSAFTSKISGIIAACIRPVLDALALQPGVLLVLCCQSDGFGYSNLDDSLSSTHSLSPHPTHHSRERLIIAQPYAASNSTTSSHPVAPSLDRAHSDEYRSLKKKAHPLFDGVLVHDQYAVLSAHDALLSLASELMAVCHDVPAVVRMKGREGSVYMQRWSEQRNSLIVVYQPHLEHSLMPCIQHTQHLLHKGTHHTPHQHTHHTRPAHRRVHLLLSTHSLLSISSPFSRQCW